MSSKQRKRLILTTVLVLIIAVTALLLWNQSDKEGANNDSGVQQSEENDTGSTSTPDEEQAEQTEQDEPDPAKPAEPTIQTDIPSLAEAYESYFPIGAAIEPQHTEGLTAELLKKHVNMIVAENAMKPASLQPMEGNFQWEKADRIVEFAKANGMGLRFHTLVWHNQSPGWFFKDADNKPMVEETDPVKREENKKLALERLDTHVRTVVERYKDDIKSWDVVNEVIEPADPDGLRASDWYKITGTDYIETAFRAAREAGGPDLKLYINDYNTEDPKKRDRLYELVKEMLDRGVPIDGVGHQLHISVHWPPVGNITDSINKFAELGLDNVVTELDMSVYAWDDRSDYGTEIPEDIIQKQGTRYGEIFSAFKANKDLISEVVFWGIADNHTWLSTFPVTRTEAPLLFDKNMQAKPAFWAVVEAQ